MQRQKLALMERNPASLYREAQFLYELGLEDFEIQFLVHRRMKEQASLKWQRYN